MAGEAARVGELALGPQDIDEDAIAPFGMQPIDRLAEDALIVQEVPTLYLLAALYRDIDVIASPAIRTGRSFQAHSRRGLFGEDGRDRLIVGEQHDPGHRGLRPVLVLGEIGDTPRDSIPAMDEGQGSRRDLGETVGDERKMGAGEHDRVHPLAAGLIEQPVHRRGIVRRIAEIATQARLGQLDQPGRAVTQDQAVAGEFLGQTIDIGLADGRIGAEHADRAAARSFGGGLDRGHGADDRQVERGAHRGERDRRRSVAGNDHQSRIVAPDQPAEQGRHTRGNLPLALGAIGKTGTVGDIDDRRVRQQRAGRRQHRQPADAGIEEQQGSVVGHRR